MPVTITFYKISENTPQHGQEIIFFRETGSFDYSGYALRQCCVEYQWNLLEHGLYNGTSVVYESEDDYTPEEAELVILFDGQETTPDSLWIDVEDYWQCFDREGL